MGAVLAAADVPILTSDNPRSERVEAIIEAMLSGVSAARRARVRVDLDRRGAIRLAARLARRGDLVLLVGKGHEKTQETAGTKHPWNDAAELRHALLNDSGARKSRRSAATTT